MKTILCYGDSNVRGVTPAHCKSSVRFGLNHFELAHSAKIAEYCNAFLFQDRSFFPPCCQERLV